MAKSSNRPNLLILALVVIAVAFIAYVWLHKRQPSAEPPVAPVDKSATTVEAPPIASDHIDPANEGRVVRLRGDPSIKAPASDPQLGVKADTVMLMRYAEMLQWREKCVESNCEYQQVWSPQPIPSGKFRVQDGHQNPERLPIAIARFASSDVRLGVFHIDAAALGNQRLGSSLPPKPVPYPVTSAQLPSNLAISFRDAYGVLYAGDPDHRAVGDMRVSYRTLPPEKVDLVGIQRGDRLILQKASASPPQS